MTTPRSTSASVVAFATLLLLLGISPPPARAEPTPGQPYPPTGTFATANAQLLDSGCFYHPYSLAYDSGPMTEEWALSIRVIAPNGSVADMASKFGSNWTRGTLTEEVLLCSSLDAPGTYTLTGTITTWPGDIDTPIPTQSFQVLPVPVADVTGTVTKRPAIDGIKLTFRASALPAGHAQGRALRWKVTYDGHTRRVTQDASERDTLGLHFRPRTGAHAIRVYRNGARVLTTTVRT